MIEFTKNLYPYYINFILCFFIFYCFRYFFVFALRIINCKIYINMKFYHVGSLYLSLVFPFLFSILFKYGIFYIILTCPYLFVAFIVGSYRLMEKAKLGKFVFYEYVVIYLFGGYFFNAMLVIELFSTDIS